MTELLYEIYIKNLQTPKYFNNSDEEEKFEILYVKGSDLGNFLLNFDDHRYEVHTIVLCKEPVSYLVYDNYIKKDKNLELG